MGDLGGDFYLSVDRGEVVGCVLVSYVRQLFGPALARIEALVTAGERAEECRSLLLARMRDRARRRGAAELQWSEAPGAGEWAEWQERKSRVLPLSEA